MVRSRRLFPLLLALVLITAFAGCTDETTVFRDQPIVEQPPEGAGSFLGYANIDQKKTTCGNCHVGYQGHWAETAHAGAWKTLQDSGHSQPFCEGCHTVGANGNPAEAGGWDSGSNRYLDVQCESCHGSGLEHAENPDDNRMYTSININLEAMNNCAGCHTGAHHPFVEQWSQSNHAQLNDHTDRASCAPCHSAQGALEAWGEGGYRFAEVDGPRQPIVCAVCHNPHGTDNPADLRFPLNATAKENNMCIRCHHKRAQPDETALQRGPHSPEGPLVLGEEVGWIPDNVEPPLSALRGSHGSEQNERLCASCHVAPLTVTDDNGFVFQSVGHLFDAIACLDENGIPVPDGDCSIEERDFSGCAISGCHSDQTAARSAYVSAMSDVDNSIATLQALLDQVPEDQFDPDGPLTVAIGADFNRKLAELPGTAVHNKFMITWLLNMSIDQVQEEYGVSAPGHTEE